MSGVVRTKTSLYENSLRRRDDVGAVVLQSGELFVESHDASVIKSAHGRIELKPGALAHIDARNGKMYVKACSGPGAVRVERPNFSANLGAGSLRYPESKINRC